MLCTLLSVLWRTAERTAYNNKARDDRVMAKTVLVSYLDNNKRIVLPSEKSECDLRDQYLTQFKFERNVPLNVTFQRFDVEWNEYVDLDDTEEIRHKDKLKAVVTPLISSNTCEGSISSSHSAKVRYRLDL